MNAEGDAVRALEGVDVVDVEIFSRTLEGIANEMGAVMVRTTGSLAIAEAFDFSTFIGDADGEIIAYGGYTTTHFGPARQSIRHLLATFDPEDIEPGDAFICNDPHTTGNAHAPDVGIVRPIFGPGDELVAWCWAEAHMVDVGGVAPGGFVPDARECFAEGLRFPGIKIVRRGRMLDDVRRLVEANFRLPSLGINEIRCFLAACNACDRRLQAVLDRHGVDGFRRNVEVAKLLARRATRARIASLPDGVYEADEYVEHDDGSLLRVHCRVTVQGDRLELDFAGSAPQSESFVNCAFPASRAQALAPILSMLVPDLPLNEGTIGAFDVHAPAGTIVNPVSPAPTSGGHIETGTRLGKVVTRIVAELVAASDLPELDGRAMAPWHDCWPGAVYYAGAQGATPMPFLDMSSNSGGAGALERQDGMDFAGALPSGRVSIPDIEMNELHAPLLYLWRRLNEGSGGAGRSRGGQGLDVAWTPWLTDGGQESAFSGCWQVPPPGLFGGYPGSASHYEIVLGAGADELLRSGTPPAALGDLGGALTNPDEKQFSISVRSGDVVRLRVGGGAGFGDPILREPGLVAADVRDSAVDERTAREVYGVVLSADGQADHAASDEQRAAIRAERRSWPAGSMPSLAAGGPPLPATVRSTLAADRLAAVGGWARRRDGVEVVEYADPAMGELLRVELRVAAGDRP